MIGFVAFVTFSAGCATMGDVIKSKDEGTSKIYPVSANQAWDITKTVLFWEGTNAIKEERAQGYMLTSSPPDAISYGAFIGVWVEPVDPNNAKVTVVIKRKFKIDYATTLKECTFHKDFAHTVIIVKSGEPLSIRPPAGSGIIDRIPWQ